MHRDWGERDERWRGVRSELVDVAGTHVHVLHADGPEDGTPQLLVHGLSGSGTNWLEVIAGLAAFGPVIAPDLPGFGRTEPPSRDASRLRGNLGFLPRLLEFLGVERATVHGNSMGGLLAVQLAARRPDLVERLVLVDPALPGPRRELYRMTPAAIRTFAPFLVPTLGRRLVGRMYASRTAEQLFDENQSFIHADPSRVSEALKAVGRENVAYAQRTPWRQDGLVAAAESLVGALVAARGILRAVDAVEAPTLLVWGDADKLIGGPVIDAAATRRPDWDLHVFEGVGHVAMAEVPDDYLAVVTDFYRRTDEQRASSSTSGVEG